MMFRAVTMNLQEDMKIQMEISTKALSPNQPIKYLKALILKNN